MMTPSTESGGSIALVSSGSPADPMTPVLYSVVSNDRVTRNVVTLVLEPRAKPLSVGSPGQFNMLWAWGIGESAISMSALDVTGSLVHTVRLVGGVTRALGACKTGDLVGARGPFGKGWPVDEARGRDLILVAGGVGLAPLRPMLREVLSNRESYGQVDLVVGARNAHEMLFRGELDRWWLEKKIRVRTTVDRACSHWSGSVGVVTNELHRVPVDSQRSLAMVCGPEAMMRAVASDLVDRGVQPDQVAVSIERRMECGVGLCGHCQLQGYFVCTDGPVFGWDVVGPLMKVREL